MTSSATPLPSLPQDAVDQVLVRRDRRLESDRRGEKVAFALAAALHAAAFLTAFAVAHFRPEPKPLEFVAAQIIPAQALGVERPRQRAAPAPPAKTEPEPVAESAPESIPEPPQPAPKPAPKPEPPAPKPEPTPTKPPSILPRPKGWNDPPAQAPTPNKTDPKPPQPTKPAASTPTSGGASSPNKPSTTVNPTGAEVGKGDEAGRRGSPTASPLGTSAFGSEVAGLDNPDFIYGYYIDRMLQLIDNNWTRPGVTGRVRTIVHFRILRNGQIEDLEIVETSGYSAFDIAALRAVQNAAPLPPLPASYRNPTLGVNLIVR